MREGRKTLATEMRHRIIIQTLTSVADGEGGFVDTWVSTQSVWAAVIPMRAQQRFDYASVNVDATHVINIRGEIPITEKQRLKFGARIFEILTVEDYQELGVFKYIVCNEKR
jgi:SPP1 family predicted phage head-tail adaptor